MVKKDGQPQKANESVPAAEREEATLPQIIEPVTPNTDDNQDATRVSSGPSPGAGANQSGRIARTPTDLRGQVISGKYSIEEKLGEGGMGSVYQAYDAMMKRAVAIKLLNQDRDISDEAWKRFQQEAHATSTLDHNHIVRIFDFNICDKHGPYLVMDLIDGEPLSSLIARKHALDPQFVADIIIQVADALQHAHEKGIIHRDLKPSNILVSAEVGQAPKAKVVDFGIAKLQGEHLDDLKLTKTGEVFGSPLYMSPEQCLANNLDKRTDIYSLGCVMYEALCGEPPFKGKNFGETVIMHTKEAPKPFPADLQIPNPLKRIVFCALEKSPADRYQTMSALKKELLNFKRGQMVRVKQKRRFWKIALLVCLATIPITAFFTLRDIVKDQPEFMTTLLRKVHAPQIVEWMVLPDDETRGAWNAVKIAMVENRHKKFDQAENILKGVWDSNPDSNRNKRLVAWPLARTLSEQAVRLEGEARKAKFDEAESYLAKTYTVSEGKLALNLRIVGTMLKYQDRCNPGSLEMYRRSVEHYAHFKDEAEGARSQSLLAMCELDAGDLDSAEKDYKEALAVLEKGKDRESNWVKNSRNGLKRIEEARAEEK